MVWIVVEVMEGECGCGDRIVLAIVLVVVLAAVLVVVL